MTWVKALKTKWSLWKYAAPAVVCALIEVAIYLAGWRMSSSSDSMPLARSGAAATAVSLGFALWDFREAVANSERRAKETVDRVFEGLYAPHVDKEARQAAINEQLKDNSNKINRAISLIYGVLLIVATIIWGFGDLVAKIDLTCYNLPRLR
jgi:hypothetical protein